MNYHGFPQWKESYHIRNSIKNDAGQKALVATYPFHPRLPSNCEGATGNLGAAAGLEAETKEIDVKRLIGQSILSKQTS